MQELNDEFWHGQTHAKSTLDTLMLRKHGASSIPHAKLTRLPRL